MHEQLARRLFLDRGKVKCRARARLPDRRQEADVIEAVIDRHLQLRGTSITSAPCG